MLVQLTIPKLRTAASIKSFNSQLKRYDYDLLAWRDNARLSARDTVLLDANNGAGWDLASALLRPRKIQVSKLFLLHMKNIALLPQIPKEIPKDENFPLPHFCPLPGVS